jgi:hypothetical protein
LNSKSCRNIYEVKGQVALWEKGESFPGAVQVVNQVYISMAALGALCMYLVNARMLCWSIEHSRNKRFVKFSWKVCFVA